MKGYFLTAKGELCSEKGHFAVDNIKLCEEAANELRYDFKEKEWPDYPDWPQGCYGVGPDTFGSKRVFFNPNPIGSSNDEARQICKPRGTE